jgi:hypothetical protein
MVRQMASSSCRTAFPRRRQRTSCRHRWRLAICQWSPRQRRRMLASTPCPSTLSSRMRRPTRRPRWWSVIRQWLQRHRRQTLDMKRLRSHRGPTGLIWYLWREPWHPPIPRNSFRPWGHLRRIETSFQCSPGMAFQLRQANSFLMGITVQIWHSHMVSRSPDQQCNRRDPSWVNHRCWSMAKHRRCSPAIRTRSKLTRTIKDVPLTTIGSSMVRSVRGCETHGKDTNIARCDPDVGPVAVHHPGRLGLADC